MQTQLSQGLLKNYNYVIWKITNFLELQLAPNLEKAYF